MKTQDLDHLSDEGHYRREKHIQECQRLHLLRMDFADLFLGAWLGGGTSRHVFEYRMDPENWVVKIDLGTTGANHREYHVWEHVQHADKIASWFAPCGPISHGGKVMLQRRTKLPPAEFIHPAKLPRFFTDIKYSNWGILYGKGAPKHGRLVCHDYANHLLLELGMEFKMRKANWFD